MAGSSIRIGDWTLDVGGQRLTRRDCERVLAPKEFAVLWQLVSAAPQAVSNEALLRHCWADVVVGDNALHQVISRLRALLGEAPRQRRYIETLPRRGYRIVASVGRPAQAPGLLTSLVVLPFEDQSAAPTDPHLADGLTYAIRAWLSRLDDVRVIGETAVRALLDRGLDAHLIASQLRAQLVLHGSVRIENDRVRVVARLDDITSDAQIWCEVFDREAVDVLDLHSDLARSIVDVLQTRLGTADVARVGRRDTARLAAFRLVQRQRQLGGGSRRDNPIGIELLEQAVAIDPEYAEAWAWLSWRHSYALAIGSRHAQPLSHAEHCARRAIEIDPTCGWGHYALGQVRVLQQRIGAAIRHYRDAATFEPSGDFILLDLCHFLTLNGQLEEALATGLKGYAIRPDANTCYHLSFPLRLLAPGTCREMCDLASAQTDDPDGALRCRLMLANLEALGRCDAEARTHAGQLAARGPRWDEGTLAAADIVQFLGEWREARRYLEPLIDSGYRGARTASLTRRSAPTSYALVLFRLGETHRACEILADRSRYLAHRIESGADAAAVFTEMAGIHVLNGELDAGINRLEQGYDHGYRDAAVLALDPMFEPLHSDRRFDALLNRMRRSLHRMAANVDRQGMLGEVDAIVARLRSAA
jgi:TolB-like protein/tetratricopeptide (TPR) repeat protein